MLEVLDAVSVHPYRQQAPETAEEEYRSLRLLLAKYQPKDKVIPIVSGEWGYSTAWKNFNDEKQGKYLPREFLTNVANDVALSIWYDWHDDGTDPKEAEHRFGIVAHDYHAGREPVYDPKPAYLAMKTLAEHLGGWRFNKRLSPGSGEDLLLFTRGDEVRVARWGNPRNLPSFGIEPKVGDTVSYGESELTNDLWRIAAAWQRLPLEVLLDSREKHLLRGTVRNPLARMLDLDLGDDGKKTLRPGEEISWNRELNPSRNEKTSFHQTLRVPGLGDIVQSTWLMSRNPLRLVAFPCAGLSLSVRMDNPSGEAFAGRLRLTPFDTSPWGSVAVLVPAGGGIDVNFAAGEKEKVIQVPLQHAPPDFYGARITLDEGDRAAVLEATEVFRRVTLDTGDSAHAITYQMSSDGDAKVASRQSLTEESPKNSPPYLDGMCFKVSYGFEPGWKFIFLSRSEIGWPAIIGKPERFGLWLHGDGRGLTPRIRFVDQSGQTFQPDAPKVNWQGWRFVTFPMQPTDKVSLSHWGGANDGNIHYPIKWDTILLLDNTDRRAVEGEIYLSAPTLIY